MRGTKAKRLRWHAYGELSANSKGRRYTRDGAGVIRADGLRRAYQRLKRGLAALVFVLLAAPAFATECGKFPAGQNQHPLTCETGGHPARLVFYHPGPIDDGDNVGELLIEGCVSCLFNAQGTCVPVTDLNQDPDDGVCPEKASPITLAQWCQELASLPIPPGTPAGVPRPAVKACSGAAQVALVSGDPTP